MFHGRRSVDLRFVLGLLVVRALKQLDDIDVTLVRKRGQTGDARE